VTAEATILEDWLDFCAEPVCNRVGRERDTDRECQGRGDSGDAWPTNDRGCPRRRLVGWSCAVVRRRGRYGHGGDLGCRGGRCSDIVAAQLRIVQYILGKYHREDSVQALGSLEQRADREAIHACRRGDCLEGEIIAAFAVLPAEYSKCYPQGEGRLEPRASHDPSGAANQ
jgi:hypothetical protein